MRNLLLTVLLALTYSSIVSANGDFQLTKANIFNTGISNKISPQISSLDSCFDACYDEFGNCLYSNESDFICEIIYDECNAECYYNYQ